MTNDHYLIVSYFVCGIASAGLGAATFRIFRTSFATIADAVVDRLRGLLLKRILLVSLMMAALLGFLSVDYRGCGMTYDQIVKDRDYLVQRNREQLQGAANWIVYVVLAWGVVVAIGLAAARKKEPERDKRI